MPVVSLDANFVRCSSCPAGKKRIDYYDDAIPGFVLESHAGGNKTYALRYRDGYGRQRQHKIGDARSLTFEQARSVAQTLRARIVLGENPAEERKAQRAVPTLAELAAQRYLPFVKGYKRSWDSDDSYLRNHLLPRFGSFHLDEISQQAVIEFHQGMRGSGYAPATANRMVILLRYIYNLARKWKIPGAETNPAIGVPLFEANNARERYLSSEESKRLVEVLSGSDNTQLRAIVVLLLLTGARKRELLDAKWEDFDLERKLWRIPISKSGKARHVPLSESVLSTLAGLKRWESCPYVVPNPKTRKPFVSVFYAWDTARKQAGMPELRMHDLRHSFASFLVNSGRSLYEVQKCLGHTQIKTSQRYSHLSSKTLEEAASAAATAAGLTIEVLTA